MIEKGDSVEKSVEKFSDEVEKKNIQVQYLQVNDQLVTQSKCNVF